MAPLSQGTLLGTVTDQNGARVAGLTVTATNRDTGLSRTAVTNREGAYQFVALPVGLYKVSVAGGGFQAQFVDGIVIQVEKTAVLDLQLNVAEVSNDVTVLASGGAVELTNVSVGHIINQRTVQEIPLNGRYFVDLGLLVPGSVVPPQNGNLSPPTRGGGSLALNTAGNREDTVNFQINGITLNDQLNNILNFNPPLSSIREFKIDNSTFSAEFGRNSGAIINVATRSGTREFHGELYEFFRNDALDARNFFNFTSSEPPPFKRNQFGATFSGPLFLPNFGETDRALRTARDKTFFFFSYEVLKQRQQVDINSVVLSDPQRASVTDPIIRGLVDLLPRANFADSSGTARFVGSARASADVSQWTLDLTHEISASDNIHGYYVYQNALRNEPTLQGTTIPGFGDIRDGLRQVLTLNEVHLFRPELINEARFGFNRISFTARPAYEADPSILGINNGVHVPIGLPQINVAGAFNFGGPSRLPQGRNDTTLVAADTVSYLRGRHSLKFGGEFRHFINENSLLDTGAFNFPSIASFIAGNANSFSITLGQLGNYMTQQSLGMFAIDVFRLRHNVTLDLGVRYDLNLVPKERDDKLVVFDPVTASLLRVGTDIGAPYGLDLNNIQPRIGIAWDPFGKGKTSVRAAYAIQVEQPLINAVVNTSFNPPLATPLSYTGTIRLENAINIAGAAGLAPLTIDHGYQNSDVQSWNFNVQQEVITDMTLMVGYFGSKGTHLRISRNINQPIAGVRPYPRLSDDSPLLPGASLGNIVQVESNGNSSYNALWTSLTKRFSRGLQFDTSYTWSKSIDYNSLSTPPQVVTFQDSYNVRGDRGLSDFDARHRFVFSAIYELPFNGDCWKDGWQLGTIIQAQSGNPVNLVTSTTVVNGIANTVRPDLIAPVNITGTVEQWFDPASFAAVPRFGSLGRNVIIGPGFRNIDLSVMKNTKLSERARLQFRFEVFDLFNTANFGQPGRTVGTPSFSRITNTRFPTGDSGSSRQLQFAIKLMM